MYAKILIIATLIFAFTCQCVSALSLSGSLMSTIWARENQWQSGEQIVEEEQSNLFFYEYLHLHAANLWTERLTAHLRGRIGWRRFSQTDGDERFDHLLYQGYLNYRVPRTIALRCGRQFLPNDVGFWQMDGVRLSIERFGLAVPTLYGGVAVAPWTIKGDKKGVVGCELNRLEALHIQSKFSLMTLFSKDEINRAILGVRLNAPRATIFDIHRDTHKRFSLIGRASVDLLTQQIISGYGYAHFCPLPPIHASIEYQHETPLYPADSIFSVFSVEPLRQFSLGLDLNITEWLGLNGGYARQFYDEGPIHRYSSGISVNLPLVRGGQRKNRFVLSYPGKWGNERIVEFRLERLVDIDAEYWRIYSYIGKRLTNRLEISLNHYYNNYRLSQAAQVEDAYSFQCRVRYQIHRNLQAFMRIEDNINPDYEYNIRAVGQLRMSFDL